MAKYSIFMLSISDAQKMCRSSITQVLKSVCKIPKVLK